MGLFLNIVATKFLEKDASRTSRENENWVCDSISNSYE